MDADSRREAQSIWFAWRAAVAIATAFGRFLVAAGVVLVLLTGALGGLWFAPIGWFLLNAAAGEGMFAADPAHPGPRVADVMVVDPVEVRPGMPVQQFLDDVVDRRAAGDRADETTLRRARALAPPQAHPHASG